VGFVDLNEIIGRRYDALGEAAVEPLFGDPHTHTSRAGAELNAECVVAGLKALKNDPVAGDFSARARRCRPTRSKPSPSLAWPRTARADAATFSWR